MATERPDVSGMLASLREYKTVLEEAISALERLEALGVAALPLPGAGGSGRHSGTQEVQSDSFFGINATEAAKRYLGMCGRRPQSLEQIEDALNRGGLKVTKASLFSIMPRAAKGRDVVKVGRGMWGLAEWYDKR